MNFNYDTPSLEVIGTLQPMALAVPTHLKMYHEELLAV